MKLKPADFKIDEAWILFELLPEPIFTQLDGPAVIFGLMDAGSCFLLTANFFEGIDNTALTSNNVLNLLKNGWIHNKKYPIKIFVPEEVLTGTIETAIQSEGISVVSVPESQLSKIVGEAQKVFIEKFFYI